MCFHSDSDQFENDGEEEMPDNDDNIEAFDGPISEVDIPLPTPVPACVLRLSRHVDRRRVLVLRTANRAILLHAVGVLGADYVSLARARLLLVVLVIALAVIGSYRSLRNAYYRCIAQRAPVVVVAGTVAYAAPAEQVQVVVAITAGVEDNKGAVAGPATDCQPPSAASQSLAGVNGPLAYPSAAAPTYPFAGVPTYSTPGSEVPTYPTPVGYASDFSGTSYPTSYGAGLTEPPPYPTRTTEGVPT